MPTATPDPISLLLSGCSTFTVHALNFITSVRDDSLLFPPGALFRRQPRLFLLGVRVIVIASGHDDRLGTVLLGDLLHIVGEGRNALLVHVLVDDRHALASNGKDKDDQKDDQRKTGLAHEISSTYSYCMTEELIITGGQ